MRPPLDKTHSHEGGPVQQIGGHKMTQFFHYFEHFIGRSEGQRGLCVGQCGQAQKHKSTAIAPKSPNLLGRIFLRKIQWQK